MLHARLREVLFSIPKSIKLESYIARWILDILKITPDIVTHKNMRTTKNVDCFVSRDDAYFNWIAYLFHKWILDKKPGLVLHSKMVMKKSKSTPEISSLCK